MGKLLFIKARTKEDIEFAKQKNEGYEVFGISQSQSIYKTENGVISSVQLEEISNKFKIDLDTLISTVFKIANEELLDAEFDNATKNEKAVDNIIDNLDDEKIAVEESTNNEYETKIIELSEEILEIKNIIKSLYERLEILEETKLKVSELLA